MQCQKQIAVRYKVKTQRRSSEWFYTFFESMYGKFAYYMYE